MSVVIDGNVVTGGMARRPPFHRKTALGQQIARHSVAGVALELEGDVMDPVVRHAHHVDDMVFAVAGDEVGDAGDRVGEPKTQEVHE